ncbi:Interphotoreceptor Matrix Proteoglycan 2 [Manis pentadactyla]|nr:Interphotoreceptor Matrix Proteoglycan 2 [Manis pentadactyla]
MRGRGGGRARWPAPVRSLLRAFRARDAAAAAARDTAPDASTAVPAVVFDGGLGSGILTFGLLLSTPWVCASAQGLAHSELLSTVTPPRCDHECTEAGQPGLL